MGIERIEKAVWLRQVTIFGRLLFTIKVFHQTKMCYPCRALKFGRGYFKDTGHWYSCYLRWDWKYYSIQISQR